MVTELKDRALRALKPEAKQYEVADSKVTGLCLRVLPSGSKRWSFRYRQGRGWRRMSLGPFPDVPLKKARELAREHVVAVADGADPSQERHVRRGDATVRELFDDCLKRHWKKNARTWREIERMLAGGPRAKGAIPRRWWSRPAKSITPRDVLHLLDDIVDAGHPHKANQVRAYLGKMFRHGIPRGFVDSNPVRDVPLPHSPNVAEAQPLTADQMRKLWSVLTREDLVVAAFYRLRILTLQRGRQVRMMKWADLDHTDEGAVAEWWVVPGSTTKKGQPDRVFLPPLARREIERLRPTTGRSEYVLESPRRRGQPMGKMQSASARIRDAAGLPKHWARWFRMTGATWMTAHGTSPDTVDRVLGHQKVGLTGVRAAYDRYSFDKEKRAAVTKWGDHLLSVLLRRKAEPGKVVAIR